MNNQLKLGLDIGRIEHVISRKINAAVIAAIDSSITIAQAYVIDFIATEGSKRDIFQRDLEKEFDLKRSSISLLIDNMVKNNLIQRLSVPHDARLKKIVLTEKAIKWGELITKSINSIENKLSQTITIEEVKAFNQVLEKIRINLN